MLYRKEIDGLRSIAVVPVIFFHAGFSFFEGGYVGVDIFLVITGYLITRIIISELNENRFSVLDFYERRARRILPALTVMILICMPFAWLLMLPDPLENFGQSAVATMLFSNNILLAMTTGYWSLAAEFKPLLHTWSLSVEEQFYIIFPIIMIFFWQKIGKDVIYILIFISILSFIFCILMYEKHPNATFYLMHTRAWEILVGAIGAFYDEKNAIKRNNILSIIGITLIFASFFALDANTPFPSAYTLLPVVGTLLVLLYAKDETIVARLLRIKFLVGTGLISYSLYLWHQPLFAFARIVSFEEPSWVVFLVLIVFCFLISVASWKYIEKPFRNKNFLSRFQVFKSSTLVILIISCAGFLLHMGQGFPERVFETGADTRAGMHVSYNERIQSYSDDAFPEGADAVNVLVVGNSQARDFSNMALETGLLSSSHFIYRDDLSVCSYESLGSADKDLIESADIIFVTVKVVPRICRNFIDSGHLEKLNIVFVGPKHFGYNLNAFLKIPASQRHLAKARMFDEYVSANIENAAILPPNRYIDLIDYASEDGKSISVFDQNGDILSSDRVHITKAGAVFFAKKLISHPAFDIFD